MIVFNSVGVSVCGCECERESVGGCECASMCMMEKMGGCAMFCFQNIWFFGSFWISTHFAPLEDEGNPCLSPETLPP